MNSVQMTGRLTRDPDIYDGMTRLRIAVRRDFKTKDGQTADFFNVVCFRNEKNFADSYLAQGIKVEVVGRLQSKSTQLVDGKTSFDRIEIIADRVGFAESKKQEEEATPRVGFADADIESVPFA